MPDINFCGVAERPYHIGDCAFSMSLNKMKTTSKQEKTAEAILEIWDGHASSTRKPVECSFAILKTRFEMLKYRVRLHHEDEIPNVLMKCMTL